MATWDEATAEAYASAPLDQAILETVELRHPTFVDEFGNVTPIRIVNANGTLIDGEVDPPIFGWMLTLEPTAPLNPSESVLFQRCSFEFTLPDQQQDRLPDLDLSVVNVSRIVSKHLKNAVAIRAKLEVTFREFLTSDVTQPSFILTGMTMSRVKATTTLANGTCSFKDLINKNFPNRVYRPQEFRGLIV